MNKPASSRLRAVAPVTAQPSRPKILIYGKPGVGKSFGAVGFPACYYIDSEGGANLPQYTSRLEKSGGVYMGPEHGAEDFDTVVAEVKALATERHPYKTLIIDSISHLYNRSILHEQIRLGDKDGFGASKKPAVRTIRALLDWCNRVDMNVIFIAQEKEVWSDKGKEGVTFDCDPKVEYALHLCMNIMQRGPNRVARVGKSRLTEFPTGDMFDWSYDDFAKRYGRMVMEAEAKPISLATESQIDEVLRLLEVVKMPPDFVEKCLSKGGADSWADMESDKIESVLTLLKSKLP